MRSARVTLVGAGPGDPDLLTVRAVRALARADAVLYDRLVPSPILDLIAPTAQREYVGKQAGPGQTEQALINARLVELARTHNFVVRLKGGDPFIFGRGFEEIEALHQHGIDYAVIPGITAALGCAAAVGIPLTHRGLAHQVTLVTAQHAAATRALDWRSLSAPFQTVVFYMGVAEIPTLQHELLAHGRAADTAVALIEQGCTAAQRVFVTTLGTLAAEATRVSLAAPALIVIGEVVAYADALDASLLQRALTRAFEHAA